MTLHKMVLKELITSTWNTIKIETNIQSSSNNMDCNFTTTLNYHIELIQ